MFSIRLGFGRKRGSFDWNSRATLLRQTCVRVLIATMALLMRFSIFPQDSGIVVGYGEGVRGTNTRWASQARNLTLFVFWRLSSKPRPVVFYQQFFFWFFFLPPAVLLAMLPSLDDATDLLLGSLFPKSFPPIFLFSVCLFVKIRQLAFKSMSGYLCHLLIKPQPFYFLSRWDPILHQEASTLCICSTLLSSFWPHLMIVRFSPNQNVGIWYRIALYWLCIDLTNQSSSLWPRDYTLDQTWSVLIQTRMWSHSSHLPAIAFPGYDQGLSSSLTYLLLFYRFWRPWQVAYSLICDGLKVFTTFLLGNYLLSLYGCGFSANGLWSMFLPLLVWLLVPALERHDGYLN